jgi:hypothetical protein
MRPVRLAQRPNRTLQSDSSLIISSSKIQSSSDPNGEQLDEIVCEAFAEFTDVTWSLKAVVDALDDLTLSSSASNHPLRGDPSGAGSRRRATLGRRLSKLHADPRAELRRSSEFQRRVSNADIRHGSNAAESR